MVIIATMLALGALLGFVGAGGSGFIIAILTLIFHIPIVTALGTSLAAMAFTSISGTYSHYKQGNTVVNIGLIVGVIGAIGSFAGSKIAAFIPPEHLHILTGCMLFLSALLLIARLLLVKDKRIETAKFKLSKQTFLKAVGLGLVTGVLSGTFGIGSAPFIQVGLIIVMGLSLRQSVGTTMLVILPIAIGGGTGFLTGGFVDGFLLLKVLIGTMVGAFIGAKFTNVLPKSVLKTTMILVPVLAGLLLVV